MSRPEHPDEHFLTRVMRLDGDELESAMTLYRNPDVVREIARQTVLDNLNVHAGDIAIRLGDGTDPSRVLIGRDGRFVTCLNQGMKVSDAIEIPLASFDAAIRRLGRRKEIEDQRARLRSQMPMGKALKSLYSESPFISKSVVARFLAEGPEIIDALRHIIVISTDSLETTGNLIQMNRRVDAESALSLSKVRETVFAFALIGCELKHPFAAALATTFLSLPEYYSAHALWGLLRAGAIGLDTLRRVARDPDEVTELRAMACVGLAAFAISRRRRRKELVELLRSVQRDYPTLGVACKGLVEELEDELRNPTKVITNDVLDGMTDEDRRVLGKCLVLHVDRSSDDMAMRIPEAKPLLLSAFAQNFSVVDFFMTDSGAASHRANLCATMKRQRIVRYRLGDPVSSASPKIGRNAPCPCGSGIKYKKCCGK